LYKSYEVVPYCHKLDYLEKIENKYFEFALSKIKSTLPKEITERYESIAKQITESRNITESKADFYK